MNAKKLDTCEFTVRRFKAFHKKCLQNCGSKKAFFKGFLIDKSHIAKGIIKNPKRSALSNEDIAAVIAGGELNFETCNEGPPMEIVTKGIFREFEWTNLMEAGTPTYIEDKVEVKVVVREGKNKNLIVTTYITDDENNISTNKEINREIW